MHFQDSYHKIFLFI